MRNLSMLGILVVVLGQVAGSAAAADQSAEAPDTAVRPWTMLVYGAADNNADGPMLHFLDLVRKALDDDPGMELILLVDRHAEYSSDATLLGEDFTGTRLYRLRRDSAQRLAGDDELPGIGLDKDVELDTADPDTLRRFIAWGKRRFPAERIGVLIYGHADGRTMCPDETDKRNMGIPELSAHLGAAESVDFLALELCNMGGLEIAYEWRPAGEGETPRFGADVLVAIPNAGPPLDWQRAFARIRSKGHARSSEAPGLDPATMTAADLGNLVIAEGLAGREEAVRNGRPATHEAAGCYDLRAAAAAKRAIDRLAVALAGKESRERFLLHRDPETARGYMSFNGDGTYVDAYDLCRRLSVDQSLTKQVRDAATEAMAAIDAVVLSSFGMSAYEGFEPGKNGIFLVAPTNGRRAWRQFYWYTPVEGQRGEYGRWAFLRDGATAADGTVDNWFELLDACFDADVEGGGYNGYRW